MRQLTRKEIKKRGCEYCLYMQRKKHYIKSEKSNYYRQSRLCMFEKCPFRELDKYETYEDYLESPDCLKMKVNNTPTNGQR